MRTRSAPLRWRRPGRFQFALALWLIDHTCAPPAGSDEAAPGDEVYEDPTPPAWLGPQLGPLTPSQYIRDFVDYVFRGQADGMLDSSEDLRPANLSLANPGFQQYWQGGDWVFTKADLDYCNSTEDCNIIYQKYGQVCAIDQRSTTHVTFDTMCELLDENCRDGSVTTWTSHNESISEIKWYPVSKSGVTIKSLATAESHVFLAPNKSIDWRVWLFTLGPNGIYVRDKWKRPWPNDYLYQYDFHMVGSNFVTVNFLEWNGTTGWVRWTVRSPRLPNNQQYIEYTYKFNNFPVRYIGLLGGVEDNSSYWELTGLGRGWLAVYQGPCKDDLPHVPPEIPSNLKNKSDIDLDDFADRLEEFGFNYTGVTHSTTILDTTCPGISVLGYWMCVLFG